MQRATIAPSRRSWRQTLRTPWTRNVSSNTRRTAGPNASSAARAQPAWSTETFSLRGYGGRMGRSANRLAPMRLAVHVDERDHHLARRPRSAIAKCGDVARHPGARAAVDLDLASPLVLSLARAPDHRRDRHRRHVRAKHRHGVNRMLAQRRAAPLSSDQAPGCRSRIPGPSSSSPSCVPLPSVTLRYGAVMRTMFPRSATPVHRPHRSIRDRCNPGCRRPDRMPGAAFPR